MTRKTLPGMKRLPNGRTVAQQRIYDRMPTAKPLVGNMSPEEFATFRAANPDHPMVKLRISREAK